MSNVQLPAIQKMAFKWQKKAQISKFSLKLFAIKHSSHMTLMKCSIKAGRANEFQVIIEHCTENCPDFDVVQAVNGRCHNNIPHIINAVISRRLDIFRQLVLLGANIDVRGPAPTYFPAVIYVLMNGSLPMLQFMMANGAIVTGNDITVVKKKSRQFQNSEIPNEGAIIEYLTKYWSHKLISAVQKNDEKAVLLMLVINKGQKICNAIDQKTKDAAIHIACKTGNDRIVSMILKYSPKCKSLRNAMHLKFSIA